MELAVDLAAVTVVLAEPEDLAHLSLRVTAPPTASPADPADVHRLADVLEAAHTGEVGAEGEVFVDPAALRFHAAGQVPADWEDRFAAMLDQAARRGRTGSQGFLRAQLIWPAPGAAEGAGP